MEIRKATVDDVYDISRIYALSWKSAYRGIVPNTYLDDLREDFWVEFFNGSINEESINVKMIFHNEVPVGAVAYGMSRDESLKDFGEIFSIYLLPEYFGKGFGNKLLESALDDLKSLGFNNVYLWVLENNINAQSFYMRNGFYKTNNKSYIEIQGERLIDIRYEYSFP